MFPTNNDYFPLSAQASRYTNGAPDIGYYYDALDYTVASLTVSGGNVTVLPGTAIATRNEYIPAYGGGINLGLPMGPNQTYAAGAVTWMNNSLENTIFNLDPAFNAFGIYRQLTTIDLERNPYNAHAYVGWVKSPRIPLTSDNWYDFASTYGVFYDAWMNGTPLDDCLDMASQKCPFGSIFPITLNWPLNTKFLPVYTDGNFPYVHISDNSFHLKIYGYAGLERHGYDSDPRHDSSSYYKDGQ
jgi:hypothetical protein